MSIDDGFRVELYLREGVPPAIADQQQRVRARLEGALDARCLTVEHHPEYVPVDDDPVFARFEDVREWSTTAGVSLSPFFERHERYDPDSEALREVVTLPVLWLTVLEGTSVRAAYPHVDGTVETVSDAVSNLEWNADGERASDAAD